MDAYFIEEIFESFSSFLFPKRFISHLSLMINVIKIFANIWRGALALDIRHASGVFSELPDHE
jgi:hypothetical protein